jgi:hypothetical protein
MTEKTITATVKVVLAIIAVAVIAVLISNQSNTGSVFGALGSGISGILCKALSPITGGSCDGTSVSSTISYG